MENKILAVVGDKEIRQSDFDMLIQQIGPQRAMQFQSPEGQKQLLDELIHQELFLINGKENNIDETEGFKKELEFVKENMIKQFAIRDLLDDVKVNEDEVEAFYSENADMFKNEESVTASHVLVDSEEVANEVLEAINNNESFEVVAEKYSSCPSAQNGGDLGSFTRGKMVPEFESAAFGLNTGEVSGPVQTQFGYHIIKVTDKTEPSQKTLEEAKEDIANTVLLKKQQAVYLDKVDSIKKNVSIEIK
jgi:peptidyl-prolyl cis-trans isomerase C